MPTGYAPPPQAGNALASQYQGMKPEQILDLMYRNGFTQEGVNAVYELRGIPNPPTLPPNMIGAHVGQGRAAARIYGADGKEIRDASIRTALNDIGNTVVDPYRERSGISNLAGGILNGVFSYAGGPVGQAIQGVADLGNKALGNDDGTSYTDGQRTSADRIGAAIGAVGNAMGGPGSYSANNAPTDTESWVNDFKPSESSGLGVGNALSGASSAGGSGMGWDWNTIVNTGATLLGGYLQGQGSKDAANASAAGSAAAIAESRRQYDQSRADQMPWLTAGTGALDRLQDPQANFLASPDYAFRRDEGTRDIGNSFSARGGAQSGNALRALTDFNSGLAGGEFNNWWNRQAGLAGIGQTSAQNLGSLGANSAANIGNALQNGANARASGVEGQTNAYTGALADLLSQYNRNRKPQYGGGWG